MSLINYTIKNMIGGVSEQPPSVRLQNQCDEMVNCIPSVTDFLKRRNGTQHINKLLDNIGKNAFTAFIRRGDNEAGLLIIESNKAKVYDLSGKLIGETNSDYFVSQNQKDDLKLMTIKDYNFILNKSKLVSINSSTIEADRLYNGNVATVFIKQAAYSTTYTVTIRGTPYKIQSMTGEFSASANIPISTSMIASLLYDTINAKKPDDISVEIYKNILIIKNLKNQSGSYYSNFTISCDDDSGGNYISCFKSEVQSFSDLPLRSLNGNIIKIRGDKSNVYDDYYVKFITNDNVNIGDGYWKECAKNNYTTTFKNMPIALNISSKGVSQHTINWQGKLIGDEKSCPEPTFKDNYINDIFFYNNRLCFLTNDSLVMSEVGNYFNFYNTTATTVLSSDPIDVSVTSQKISNLKYALEYNEGLFLYSDTALFAVEHSEPMSSLNISITPIIQFDSELSARPEIVGSNIFYSGKRGNNSSIREYIPGATGDIYGYSNDITSHIPTYIPLGIRKITGSMEESIILAFTGNNEIYIYKYQNNSSGDKVQSSWGKWVFSGNIINGEIINGVLYLIIDYSLINDGIYLEKIVFNDTKEVYQDRFGYKETDYVSKYVYSTQFLRMDSMSPTITAGYKQIRNLTIKFDNSSQFKIIIERLGRKKEERVIKPDINQDEVTVPILSKNNNVKISIESHSNNNFKLIESRFEIFFSAKSQII